MQVHTDKQVQYASGNGLQGSASDIDENYFVIDRAAFNQGKNAKYNIMIERGGQHQH